MGEAYPDSSNKRVLFSANRVSKVISGRNFLSYRSRRFQVADFPLDRGPNEGHRDVLREPARRTARQREAFFASTGQFERCWWSRRQPLDRENS